MLAHNNTIQLQVNTGALNPYVSLNVRHAKLNWQSCNMQVIIPILTHDSISDMQ